MRKTMSVSVFLLLLLLLGAGLDVTLSREPLVEAVLSSAPNTTTIEPQVQKRVLNLAGRFLYEEVDDQARVSILDDIRALSDDETRLFMDFVFAIQAIGFPEDDPAFSDSVVRPQRQAYVLVSCQSCCGHTKHRLSRSKCPLHLARVLSQDKGNAPDARGSEWCKYR